MARKVAGPANCMAVTVCSAAAMSMPSCSWAVAPRTQPSVTASAGVAAVIASASAPNRPTSARQACSPASLSSGSRWS